MGHITSPLCSKSVSYGRLLVKGKKQQPSGRAWSATLATLRPDFSLLSPPSLCTSPLCPSLRAFALGWTLCLMTTGLPPSGLTSDSLVRLPWHDAPTLYLSSPICLSSLALTLANILHHLFIILFNVSLPHQDVNSTRVGLLVWWSTALCLMLRQCLVQDRRLFKTYWWCFEGIINL